MIDCPNQEYPIGSLRNYRLSIVNLCYIRFVRHFLYSLYLRFLSFLNIAAIDSPEGFLSEWWSVFSDTYMARVMKVSILSNLSL